MIKIGKGKVVVNSKTLSLIWYVECSNKPPLINLLQDTHLWHSKCCHLPWVRYGVVQLSTKTWRWILMYFCKWMPINPWGIFSHFYNADHQPRIVHKFIIHGNFFTFFKSTIWKSYFEVSSAIKKSSSNRTFEIDLMEISTSFPWLILKSNRGYFFTSLSLLEKSCFLELQHYWHKIPFNLCSIDMEGLSHTT